MKILFKILLFSLILVPFSVSAVGISQWYLEKIKAEQAWETTTGKKQVVVAILDTRIDINHPDLIKNIWVNMDEMTGNEIDNDGNGYIDDINGWDFIRSVPNPRPFVNKGYTIDAVHHGTFVAGVIAAMRNDLYVNGVAPDIKIMPLKVLNEFGYGDSYPVAEAINYAVDNGADVINLSFGGVEHSQSLKSAILRAHNAGIVVVSAAGNVADGAEAIDLAEHPVYPICYDTEWEHDAMIGVAAMDEEDKKADFSNYGKDVIDISAPGIRISGLAYQDDKWQDFPDYTIDDWHGTSFATAMVSGAAALLKSINSDWNGDEIRELLVQSADNVEKLNPDFKDQLGSGRLNVLSAVEAAEELAGLSRSKFFVSSQKGDSAIVQAYNFEGEQVNSIEVFGGAGITGLNLAATKIAGEQAVIVGGVAGEKPWVRAVNLDGRLLGSFLAYDLKFLGGVKVAVGDVDADDEMEIVALPQTGRKAEIKIFSLKGKLKNNFVVPGQVVDNMSLAVGDVDSDGKDEILVGAGKGMSPEIKIFDEQGNLQKKFSAFVPQFQGGLNITVADVQGSSSMEIIAAAGAGGGPHVQIFDYAGNVLNNFFAYDLSWREGLHVGAIDFDKNGKKDILVHTTKNEKTYLKIFNTKGAILKNFNLATGFSGKWNLSG